MPCKGRKALCFPAKNHWRCYNLQTFFRTGLVHFFWLIALGMGGLNFILEVLHDRNEKYIWLFWIQNENRNSKVPQQQQDGFLYSWCHVFWMKFKWNLPFAFVTLKSVFEESGVLGSDSFREAPEVFLCHHLLGETTKLFFLWIIHAITSLQKQM